MRVDRSCLIALALLAGFCSTLFVSLQRGLAKEYPRITTECLACHDDARESLVGTVHEIRVDAADPLVSCTGCHTGTEAHMEDPVASLPGNPESAATSAAADLCSGCHTSAHQQNMQEWNIHARSDVNCSGCHRVHSNRNPDLLKKPEPGLCIDCHPKIEGDFARSFRHPVFDGVQRCTECHLSLDQTHRDLGFRGTGEVCFTCHAQLQGPFPFEHKATVDYSTEEGGCMNCHEAHGSDVPGMLKQSYETPHFAVCSQCHVVPKHQWNSQHETEWAGRGCDECHVDIHGSYYNRLFLSPVMEGQGCKTLGCHDF